MSNGDDVLDNWEEIDEAGFDSKLNQINRNRKESSDNQSNSHQELEQSMSDLAMSFHNGIPMMMVMQQTENEYKSSSYMTQAMPAVKILRRPVQHSSVSNRNNGVRPKQPIKTLQQREQEYAQARLRILGSAKNPEDDVETCSQGAAVELIDTTTSLPNSGQSTTAINNSIMRTDIVVGSGLRVDANLFSPTSSMMVGGTTNTRYNENVLRMPRGPDGTCGFQMRR